MTNVVSNTLTLLRPLTGAPGSGVVVYASSRFTRANSGPQDDDLHREARRASSTRSPAAKVKVKIEGVDAKGTALLSVEVDAASYSRTTKASPRRPTSPGSPRSGAGREGRPASTGTGLARGRRLLSSIPGVALSFIETVGDADNKAGVQITNGDPRGSIKAYYLAQNRIDFEAAASIPARHVLRNAAQRWAIYVPRRSPSTRPSKIAAGSSARTFRSRRATTRPIRSSRSRSSELLTGGPFESGRARGPEEGPEGDRAPPVQQARRGRPSCFSSTETALFEFIDPDARVPFTSPPLRGRDVPPPPDPLGEVDRPPERLDPRGRTSSPARGLRARRREGRPPRAWSGASPSRPSAPTWTRPR